MNGHSMCSNMASESSVGGVGGSAMLGSTSRMHFVPERLQIQETAPQTDEEWDIALELYVSCSYGATVPCLLQV